MKKSLIILGIIALVAGSCGANIPLGMQPTMSKL